jgi:coenzyme F420-reducing hydrogenase delta subunit
MKQLICLECEQPAPNPVFDRAGSILCSECAAAYFILCAGCQGLFPQDEAKTRGDSVLCPECFAKPYGDELAELPDEATLESLIAEYVALHAEEKRVSERLGQIKEQLKTVALMKERVAGTVVLRAGDSAVKCSYKVGLKLNPERAEELERILDEDQFASLVERKISFSPIKEKIEEFLKGTDEEGASVRELLQAALERTETASLTVIPPKKR